ncbi:IS3 family transposase, partial [Shinella sp. 838]|uniref:IS3 family transposase n=1 Tax=Shinella sp. 838 TaxID=3038164 RepID=UPI002415523B
LPSRWINSGDWQNLPAVSRSQQKPASRRQNVRCYALRRLNQFCLKGADPGHYVATWQGFVYVAFVIDAFARRIVGWRASRAAHAGFVLDALDQALHDRRPVKRSGLVHHSDRGSQYVSIRYSERLAEAGIEPSVGSVGDSYDNALAETINGLYKAEVIHRRGPWRNFEAVEFATLEWVDWFNNRRLLEPIGNIPPAEAEEQYYAMLDAPAMAA